MVLCKTVMLGSVDHGQSLAQMDQALRFGECLSRRILWKATCLSRKTIADGVTYSLSNFSVGDPMPYADIAQQITPCFTVGTWIDTLSGARPMETLRVGDLVSTRYHGPQSIRWIGKKSIKLAPNFPKNKFRPIQISEGALGQGLPRAPLRISRQHRLLLSSPINQRMFGTQD